MFQGKKVQILLHTPILVEIAEESGKSRRETVVKLLGQIQADHEAGLQLEAAEFFNDRQQKVPAPYRLVFLPFHKIDHIFVI